MANDDSNATQGNYTPTIRSPPRGGGSQTKRHSMRSSSPNQKPMPPTPHQRPQSPTQSILSASTPTNTTHSHASPSIHKSLNALDAKFITMNMERSTLQQMRTAAAIAAAAAANARYHHNPSMDDLHHHSPTSPSASSINTVTSPGGPNAFYPRHGHPYPASHHRHPASTYAASVSGQQPLPPLPGTPGGYQRQGSFSALSFQANPSTTSFSTMSANATSDLWHTFCVRVLPLFNGEGVQGTIEELNELLRRCLTDPILPQLQQDIVSLLHDGMFTLNAKMFGVTDEKLLDRLVEQWSFFFTYALPYFEAVFLPLRTDVHYRSQDEAETWNVRTIALQSFRDNVILMQIKRLEDVFNKLFTDFGATQNPAATAAKMLQMTSLLASCPDHNEEIDRVLSNLKANWKIMMNKGNRRGFAGVRKPLPIPSSLP
ncbi:HbrB-domain-containing protein [Hesseltinella vesiculosa]|uniref:HbrB-domain-containing protein n=1 Tax=Hesseltinella vesiculosa TaxID=101127 RepID=A0A1X2GAH5_9FUNG|nr:HbrB-domain-containing protein [Hesseltinella vesiculosa]